MAKKNSDALPAGYELNGSQYKIKHLLGDGGFGLTYLANDSEFERDVAIKEFFPSSYARRIDNETSLKNEEYQQQFNVSLQAFEREGKALAKCDHRGVVDVFDRFEEHGTAYLVMKLVQGSTLDVWMKQHHGDFVDEILPGLLDALEYIHGKKLVHRDLKPANIMIRENDGQPVLIDFGSTRIDFNRDAKTTMITTTEIYAAPELFAATNLGHATPASDLYALGAMLYEYVTGELPLRASLRTINDELGPVSEKAAVEYAHHTGLLKAIDAALVMSPKQRLQDISAFRALLKEEQPQYKPPSSNSILHEESPAHRANDTSEEPDVPDTMLMENASNDQGDSADEDPKAPKSTAHTNEAKEHPTAADKGRASAMLISVKRHSLLALFCIIGSFVFSFYAIAHVIALFGNSLLLVAGIATVSGALVYGLAIIYDHYWIDRDNTIKDDVALFIGMGLILCLTAGLPYLSSKDYEKELCRDFYERSFLNPFGLHIVSDSCQVKPEDLYKLLNNTHAFSVELRTTDQRSTYYDGQPIPLELKRRKEKDSRLLLDYIIPNKDGSFSVQHQSNLLNNQGNMMYAYAQKGSDTDTKPWIILATVTDSKWPNQIQTTEDGKQEESLNNYYSRLLRLRSLNQLPRSSSSKKSINREPKLATDIPTKLGSKEVVATMTTSQPISEIEVPDMTTAYNAVQALKQALPNQGGASLQVSGEDQHDRNGQLRFYLDLRVHKGFVLEKPYVMVDFIYVTAKNGLVVDHKKKILNKHEEWVNSLMVKNDRTQEFMLVWLSDQKWPKQFQTASKIEKPLDVWKRLSSYARSGVELKVAVDYLDLR